MSKSDATPRERAYQLALQDLNARWLELGRSVDAARQQGQSFAHDRDTMEQLAKLHNQLLDRSKLHGIHLSERAV